MACCGPVDEQQRQADIEQNKRVGMFLAWLGGSAFVIALVVALVRSA